MPTTTETWSSGDTGDRKPTNEEKKESYQGRSTNNNNNSTNKNNNNQSNQGKSQNTKKQDSSADKNKNNNGNKKQDTKSSGSSGNSKKTNNNGKNSEKKSSNNKQDGQNKDDKKDNNGGKKENSNQNSEQSQSSNKQQKQEEPMDEEERLTMLRRERQQNSRVFKLYRCPPTPEPVVLRDMEYKFVSDCTAVHFIQKTYSNANPKLGSVIPPYNSQTDMSVGNYFKFDGVDRTLKRSGQDNGGTSTHGRVIDYFYNEGKGAQYLKLRNINGCGRSPDLVDGHGSSAKVKPFIGYNGRFGYRRNTPNLRNKPSSFEVCTKSAIF